MTTVAPFPAETSTSGAFVRQEYTIRDRVTADGSSGFKAEPGRYHLYVSPGCPWAHRTIIVRKLLGLEDVISLSAVAPIRDERGWAFYDGPGHSADPVNGFQFLAEAYHRTDPTYNLRYTVPALWDRATERLVSNNFPDITIDLETQFTAFHKPGAPELYPAHLRDEIDAVNELIYHEVNNGVYKAGFAATQAPYEAAVAALFARLDWLEERLSRQRYLVGNQLSEADVRLYPTLARFDAVYYLHFKCNLRRIVDYPALWAYLRDLYQTPGFGDTTDLDFIKRMYYGGISALNPLKIIPKGPLIDWHTPHGRESLGAA